MEAPIIMGKLAMQIESAVATFLRLLPLMGGSEAADMVAAINTLRAVLNQQGVGTESDATEEKETQPAAVGKQPPPPSNVGLGGPGSSFAAPLSPPHLGDVGGAGKSAAADISVQAAAAAAAAAQQASDRDLDVDDDWKGEAERPTKHAKTDLPPPAAACAPSPASPAGEKSTDGNGQAGEEGAGGVHQAQRQTAVTGESAPGAGGGQPATPLAGSATVDGEVEMGVNAQGRQEATGSEEASNRFRRRRPEDSKDDIDGDGRDRSRTPPRSEAASAASGAPAAAQGDADL